MSLWIIICHRLLLFFYVSKPFSTRLQKNCKQGSGKSPFTDKTCKKPLFDNIFRLVQHLFSTYPQSYPQPVDNFYPKDGIICHIPEIYIGQATTNL